MLVVLITMSIFYSKKDVTLWFIFVEKNTYAT